MNKIGKYNIVGELGRGAMGIVYKAEDPDIGRSVAIKTIHFDASGHRPDLFQAQERFMREARSAGNLSHANIVTIYEVGKDEDFSYIAMEYVEGPSLEDLIDQGKKFSIEEITSLSGQIGDALDYAHRKGVIHRDVKPGNILLDQEGKPHLVDFGIARLTTSNLTQTSTVIGTPSYMSPEQITGKTIDGRSDIFSLSVILYELLTGQKPFRGDDITTVMYKIVNENPPAIKEFGKDIPAGLDYILRKALAKEPESRYQTGRELYSDLLNHSRLADVQYQEEPARIEKALEQEFAAAEPPEARRRKPLLFLLIAMMAVVITAIALVYQNYFKSRSYSGGKGGVVTSREPQKREELETRSQKQQIVPLAKPKIEKEEEKHVIPPEDTNKRPPKEIKEEQQVIPEIKDDLPVEKPPEKPPKDEGLKEKIPPKYIMGRGDYEDAALSAILEKDRRRVEKLLEDGFRLHPNSAKLWSVRALYYLHSNDIPDHMELALKSAKQALNLDGDEPQCYAVLKIVYMEINDGQDIDEFYDIEDDVAAQHSEYYIVMGEFYEKVKMFSDATEYYLSYLIFEPTHRDAKKARQRMTELTIASIIKETPAEVRNKQPIYTQQEAVDLAWDAIGNRDVDKLFGILKNSIYHYPRSDRLWGANAAFYLMQKEAWAEEEALKCSNIALALNPSNPNNSTDLGWVYQLKFLDYEAAFFHYKNAESLGFKSYELYYNLGFCADQLMEIDSAIKYYTRFLEVAPNDERAPKAKSRIRALREY